MLEFKHFSVLLKECIEGLNINESGVYVDGTAGGGGHSKEILKKLSSEGKLVCLDKDPDAIKHLLNVFDGNDNAWIVRSDFRYISDVLDDLAIDKIDGVLLDLGVSSYQLDNKERGFCYSQDAYLDMRMTKEGISAYDIVNTYSVSEIARILFEFGEEKFGFSIAKNIDKARQEKKIETTFELVDIIRRSIPAKMRRTGGNPSKRTFQALRIAVNDELGSLSECLDKVFDRLKIGGRLCIITFHSLEDRIVKRKFSELSTGCKCPPSFPVCVCGKKPAAKLISRKAILPTDEEISKNSRSKSAKLRIIEKIGEI